MDLYFFRNLNYILDTRSKIVWNKKWKHEKQIENEIEKKCKLKNKIRKNWKEIAEQILVEKTLVETEAIYSEK